MTVTFHSALRPETFRDVFWGLAAGESHAVLLDSCGLGGDTASGYWMGFGASETIQLEGAYLSHTRHGRCVQNAVTPETLWAELENLMTSEDPDTLWFAALGYELNHWVEPTVPRRECGVPLGELYAIRPQHWVAWSQATGHVQIASDDAAWVERARRCFEAPLDSSESAPPKSARERGSIALVSASSEAVFSDQVEVLLEHIRAGDVYQANLSLRKHGEALPEDAIRSVYERLVAQNPSPFSGVFCTPQGQIICNSPERLVAYDPDTNILDTRPIAGTRGRGEAEERELQDNIKEHAEHLMLLDLMRNDLARVAEAASVTVPQAFYLERYSHVTHLVSQVTAKKHQDASVWDVLRAVFPGGTITGCPKVRCMQILNVVETLPRAFYTGSLGVFHPASGRMDWNILIRSLYNWPSLNRLDAHAGAGIVADSVPSWEYKESQRKLQAIELTLALPATTV
jgi:para-aminobenzoate synthetase component I